MRDWNLPRPLVRWLDALDQNSPKAPKLLVEVNSHLEGLEARAWALRSLLTGFPESAELWVAYQKALAAYRQALSLEQPDRDAILDGAVGLEEAIFALRGLAAELPRITGHGALDEIFVIGMSLARGGPIEPDALLSRLVAGREAVVRLQSQAALFRRAFPAEEEIALHLSDSIEALEEGLGGAFLYLAQEQDGDMLEQAMRTLASGGSAAVAALAAIKEVSEADHRFSEDPVLEEVFRAVEAADPERIEVGLIAIDEGQETMGDQFAALARTFAPASWRSGHLSRLQQAWTALEAGRERLHQAQADERLSHTELNAFQELATTYDELENEAAESLPTRSNLPDVAHLVGLVELMGAVFEERAPLALLADELSKLVDSYRAYQARLEKVYEGESQAQTPELERLLEVSEELGQALSLLDRALQAREVALFPQVWDALVEPARELQTLATSRQLESLAAEPDAPLMPFFSELRALWRDRLARRIGPGEFIQALAKANKEIESMSATLAGSTRPGASDGAALDKLAAELSSLCRRAMTGPEHSDLETIEVLGEQWERQTASARA